MQPQNYIDLHIHTTHSDGLLTPEQVVDYSHMKKLAAIAITDHDQVSAIAIAQKNAAAHNIEVIPGIEISTSYDEKEIHLLGLFINPEDVSIQEYVKLLLYQRELRAKKILERLSQLGIRLPFGLVKLKANGGAKKMAKKR